jgi:serine/threonine protein kinase
VAAAFPQLEVLELIGRGGMGFVFKARQPHLDRFVALKLLPEKLARDARFTERFNREGRVLARLNHPNIVTVYDFGMTEHFYYLVMEFVDGVNLRQAMQAGRFLPGEALAIVPKICEALQYAHAQGILHRDIKPANILLDSRGHVKIADFGIAKLVGEEGPDLTLTATGVALGTPHYMAPEQLEKPSEVDHRADIYSLGVVFYEMLTGELPIGRFAAPSSKTPVGANVDEVVFRTLERDRERRYQSAGEMKTQIDHLGNGDAGVGKVHQRNTPSLGLPRPLGASVETESKHQPSNPVLKRPSVLKLVFIGLLLLSGMSAALLFNFSGKKAPHTISLPESTDHPSAPLNSTSAKPWGRFTFTAVEIREIANERWLAIDYVDDIHGEGQKAFAWESNISKFKPETRASELLTDYKDSPSVRHQRIEYRIPDSISRERFEKVRGDVEKTLRGKSIRLELGEKALLFELFASEDSSLKAWIKVLPPLKISP